MKVFFIVAFFATVVTLNLVKAATLLSDVPLAQMPPQFLGEPKIIDTMRIDDFYLVPAQALMVDRNGKCWLDKTQTLKHDSVHQISVYRYLDDVNKALYGVIIKKEDLNGWMWKLGVKERHDDGNFIPVSKLSASLD